MKWEIGYKEKFPAWRSSDGQLREKKGETDEPVTGYIPSERERRLDTGPKKIMDFANSYGALSAGFDEKKQLVLVTSQQHTKELSGLPPESKAVDAETAKKVSPITGDFYVNQDKERKEDSAVAYRVDAGLRLEIWKSVFPQEVPLEEDVDFRWLAQRFDLTGAYIKNIALSAAFAAAEEGRPVNMLHILKGLKREMVKEGRTLEKSKLESFGYLFGDL